MFQGAPGRWRSWVALTILIWALLDLCVPGLCTTEEERLPAGAPSGQEYVPTSGGVHSAQIQPANAIPTDGSALENDCWCCCSHIVPAPDIQMAVISSFTYEEAPVFERPSLGWRPLLYHPPRG